MGVKRQDDRWAFLDEDPDLDEEGQAVRTEASELKAQGNALTEFAEEMPDGRQRSEKLREAIAMYNRADTIILRHAKGRHLLKDDRDLVLQCRLNAACLSLKIGDEKATERLCNAASDLDAENPHVALFWARLHSAQGKRELAERWLERAKARAKERGEEQLLANAADFFKPRSSDAKRVKQNEAAQAATRPTTLVQEGVAFIKQRRFEEAEDVLRRAIHFLDLAEHGGPIERIAARAPRALAFNALEGLSEVYASLGRWSEAVDCGQRALELLKEGELEVPFPTPEVHRREGHLCFSMGHVTDAAGGDPVPSWRRAARALQKHGGDFSTEGSVLLKIGLHLMGSATMKEGRCDDAEAPFEAVGCLEKAADRFGRARMRLVGEGIKLAAHEHRCSELARQELEAQANLAKLLFDSCEHASAESVLDSSGALLDLAPASGAGTHPRLAEAWADLCGLWALSADKLRRLPETEQALLIQCRLLREAGSKEAESDALKALAVVRRQRRDEAGVEEALASVEKLAPEEEKEEVVSHVRRKLQRVAPAVSTEISTSDEPAKVPVADAAPRPNSSLLSGLRQNPRCAIAALVGFVAVSAGVAFQLATFFAGPATYPDAPASWGPAPSPAD